MCSLCAMGVFDSPPLPTCIGCVRDCPIGSMRTWGSECRMQRNTSVVMPDARTLSRIQAKDTATSIGTRSRRDTTGNGQMKTSGTSMSAVSGRKRGTRISTSIHSVNDASKRSASLLLSSCITRVQSETSPDLPLSQATSSRCVERVTTESTPTRAENMTAENKCSSHVRRVAYPKSSNHAGLPALGSVFSEAKVMTPGVY
jgi:hypothetical protein